MKQNKINSRESKSCGTFLKIFIDKPNIIFIHDLKKKEGTNK